jgi:Carboxypeptidase regulatory-like domain
MRRTDIRFLIAIIVLLCAASPAAARDVHGQVFFHGLPVPGATVTVTQDGKHFSTVTDDQGLYDFADLADGLWKIRVEMSGFSPLTEQITVAPNMPQGSWELKLLDLAQLLPQTQAAQPLETRPQPATQPAGQTPSQATPSASPQQPAQSATQPSAEQQQTEETNELAADGLLINGSQNNAATSQFNLAPAFGNQRPGSRDLFNGSIGTVVDNSALDARPYSLTGEQIPKAAYNRITTLATLGGPLRIPHLMPHGPNFFAAYQWTRNADATNQTGLVPDPNERGGNLSGLTNAQGQPITIYNPATGLPVTGSIPVSPQAAALLNLYPTPNVTGNSLYNYQTEVLNNTHGDALESRLNKTLGRRDQVYGGFGFRSSRANSTNLFHFVDNTNTLGLDTNVNWSHRVHGQIFALLGYHFTRMRTEVQPQFANRENISGLAGITGNDTSPEDWGPPSLQFSSGIASLNDANSEFNRNRTDAFSLSVTDTLWRHNLTFGADYRKQEFNEYQQQNPRGSFTFTGAATQGSGAPGTSGSDLADFLFGIPDTSALAYGNPDKYFRESVYDLYANDDWRLLPQLTINAGMRWDYGAPMTELKGRLVNLDIAKGFTAATPVVGSDPVGGLTGTQYPSSLVRPDKLGFEPRIGIAWRPLPASTLVIRGGYGIYDDTSVYLNAAESMAQQAPLSTSLNVSNSATCPLTLANGFRNCSGVTADNFAIDPNLRVGYAQNWQLSAQTDLPWALVMTATYMGSKGTHGMQEFYPNTYPIGAANPCPSCPSGFVYRTSGGNSEREAGQFQLRRRLRSGFAATVQYTFAKAIDNDAQVGALGHVAVTTADHLGVSSGSSSGGQPLIAQNWLNLRAERSRSSFDQRQLLTVQAQYTTGMGLGGRTLMSGWRGRLIKEWTVTTQISAGSGLPESPVYMAAVPGTGFSGTIRPDLTGAPIYQATGNAHLNVNAYTAPASGEWGTAGRNSITGPSQFSLSGSMARTFRLRAPYNLDVRIDATNLLNHATFGEWNPIVNNTIFGLPFAPNAMRSLQITGRLRF